MKNPTIGTQTLQSRGIIPGCLPLVYLTLLCISLLYNCAKLQFFFFTFMLQATCIWQDLYQRNKINYFYSVHYSEPENTNLLQLFTSSFKFYFILCKIKLTKHFHILETQLANTDHEFFFKISLLETLRIRNYFFLKCTKIVFHTLWKCQ